MASRKCNLTKRIQTDAGLRYCPVVESANGRIKPDIVWVNNKEEKHTEGAYYLEWRDGAKRIRISVGKNVADATAEWMTKKAELNAIDNGVQVVAQSGAGHRSLAAAIAEYLEETKLSKKPKTYAAYTTALAYFTESCSKTYLEGIERKDLLKFAAFLRDEKELEQVLECDVLS